MYLMPQNYILKPFVCAQLLSLRRQWQPTPALLPGKSHGWRSLVGCSPWGRTESDMTEVTQQQQQQLLSHVQLFVTPGLQPTRVLCPWDSPCKNTRMGCHSLLQGIFPTHVSNLHLLCLLHCRHILYPLSHQGSPLNHFKMVKIITFIFITFIIK